MLSVQNCKSKIITLNKYSFLPYEIREWNKLDPKIRKAETYACVRKMLLNFIMPTGKSIFDPLGVKLLTRLLLGFSHLLEQKFRHNFAGSLNPSCSFLFLSLSCIFFYAAKIILLYAEPLWLSLNENDLLHVIMYGNKNFDNNMNIRTFLWLLNLSNINHY